MTPPPVFSGVRGLQVSRHVVQAVQATGRTGVAYLRDYVQGKLVIAFVLCVLCVLRFRSLCVPMAVRSP